MQIIKKCCCVLFMLLPLCLASVCSAAPSENTNDAEKAKQADREFAVVGKEVVLENEYTFALQKGVREKFFHGKVSRNEMEEFKKSIAQKLVDQILL